MQRSRQCLNPCVDTVSACTLDGSIYIIGGEDNNEDIMSSVRRFDPVANLWSAVAPMSVARATLGSFVIGGNIYAVGGYGGGNWLSSMERYSVVSDSWSEVRGGELCTARRSFGVHVMRLEVARISSIVLLPSARRTMRGYIYDQNVNVRIVYPRSIFHFILVVVLCVVKMNIATIRVGFGNSRGNGRCHAGCP
jgi:hypothetical protein